MKKSKRYLLTFNTNIDGRRVQFKVIRFKIKVLAGIRQKEGFR